MSSEEDSDSSSSEVDPLKIVESAEEEEEPKNEEEEKIPQVIEMVYVKQELEASVFMNKFTLDEISLILFRDDLVTFDEYDQPVGSYSASIEKVRKKGEDLLFVRVEHNGKTKDSNMGNSLEAYLDMKTLQLIEQNHCQHLKMKGHEMNKRTMMKYDQETETLNVEREIIKNKVSKTAKWSHKVNVQLLATEGLNVALQRLMVRYKVQKEYAFYKVDNDNGQLCRVIYKPLPCREQNINGHHTFVSGIERLVASPDNLPMIWQSYFLPDGHVTMIVQVGASVVSQVEIMPTLIEREIPDPKPQFGKKKLVWEEDLEMRSRFLDRKEELEAGHKSYLRSHPEVNAILSDFFQHVLIRRPDNVVDAAAKYFASFSNEDCATDTIHELGEIETKISMTSCTSDKQLPSYRLASDNIQDDAT